jgi:hypothetical protein
MTPVAAYQPSKWIRYKVASAVRLVAAGASAMFVGGCGSVATAARHSKTAHPSQATYADYPALNHAGPSGIAVVSLQQARAEIATESSPIWIGGEPSDPEAVVPEISSAREVRHEKATRVWIARSSRAGVCLLVFNPEFAANPARDHSITAYCNAAAGLAKGVLSMELRPHSRETRLVVGLVPVGVSYASVIFADGAVQRVRVADDSYALIVTKALTAVSFTRDGERQTFTINPRRT